ncbi:hypothetical protein N7492_005016 [Penicillium capsulatum]|uniref:Nuclear envelope protein n=1 Tax=Penicillium capsulatum TaxID=69766 RepID=A0A9W9IB34_9EURO|nr:hypothetical protein N7492_005016 [Penicillium capsulatum]
MAAAKVRPYRRILTSALHRRFVHASALALLVCYFAAIVIGEKTSFFILRVGQMHLGARTGNSSIATLKWLFPMQIIQTFGWYLFSAWWFTEVYIWSSPADAHLEQVIRGRSHERPLLNERPIYIHTFHLLLACVQAVAHLYNDYDRISIPITQQTTNKDDDRIHPVPPTMKHIQDGLPRMIIDGLRRSSIAVVGFPLLYQILLRRTAWSWSMYFAKLVWNFPRSASEPDTWLPPNVLQLVIRTFFSGSLLVICWQSANLSFSVFIGKEPLKRGQPLTEEAKDPNGSLLTGLKSKKPVVKAFALWELSLITQRLPERRKAIFNEIDRDGGATWSQVFESTTEVIKSISARIAASKAVMSAPEPTPKPTTQALAKLEPAQPVVHTLPRLTSPLNDESVFVSSPKGTSRQDRFGEAFSSAAKSYGQSPDWTPQARARARLAFDRASAVILTPERKDKLLSSDGFKRLSNVATTGFNQVIYPHILGFFSFPIQQPFIQTFAQRASSVVLGTPESSSGPILDAVESLTRLLIASLAEDQYGKVQSDVQSAILLFTNTIVTTETFVYSELEPHWSDIRFSGPPRNRGLSASRMREIELSGRAVPDVEVVLGALKNGLKDLLTSFNPYLRDIGLQGKDLRDAEKAAGINEEEHL